MRRASSNRSRSSASEAADRRSEASAERGRRPVSRSRTPRRDRVGSLMGGAGAGASAVARRVAATASARTDPSSIQVSSVRSSIRARSIAGSRGGRGPRRSRTSAARRSASVRGSRRLLVGPLPAVPPVGRRRGSRDPLAVGRDGRARGRRGLERFARRRPSGPSPPFERRHRPRARHADASSRCHAANAPLAATAGPAPASRRRRGFALRRTGAAVATRRAA